jgi:F0F1-type ATP synthase epsilon subunit
MLRVELYRGHRCVFEGPAESVVMPGEDGELSVLTFHAPMVCAVVPGSVRIDDRRMPVGLGIARVANNCVTIVTT